MPADQAHAAIMFDLDHNISINYVKRPIRRRNKQLYSGVVIIIKSSCMYLDDKAGYFTALRVI
jgi:hypothetical protein